MFVKCADIQFARHVNVVVNCIISLIITCNPMVLFYIKK